MEAPNGDKEIEETKVSAAAAALFTSNVDLQHYIAFADGDARVIVQSRGTGLAKYNELQRLPDALFGSPGGRAVYGADLLRWNLSDASLTALKTVVVAEM